MVVRISQYYVYVCLNKKILVCILLGLFSQPFQNALLFFLLSSCILSLSPRYTRIKHWTCRVFPLRMWVEL